MPLIRLSLSIVTALLILLLIWTAAWFGLVSQMHLPYALKISSLVFFILSFGLQIFYLLQIKNKKPNRTFVFLTFFSTGLFIHLFCAAITKDLLILIPFFADHEASLAIIFTLLAILFNLIGVKIAFDGPQVKHVFISVSKKHAALTGFKIVQISDLHVGPLIGKNYLEKVVEKTNLLHADLVVLTGDIGDSDAHEFGPEIAPLKNLKSSHGTFFVTGNHEYYWKAKEWLQVIQSLGIHTLINEGLLTAHSKIWLGGITDPDAHHFIPEQVSDSKKAIDLARARDAYRILLAHQPKSYLAAGAAGFNLMLSGHTHGGQFFPGNLLVGFFNPFSKGLNRHGALQIYVNRGTGFWGPALRLGVPAEITLIEFKV